MTIATYAQLQTAIADFINRDDLSAVAPTFITLAEAQIARDVRDWRMERRAVALFDEGFEYLPDDWVETIRVNIPGVGEVTQVGHSEMMAVKASGLQSGPPFYYTHTAGRIEVFPIPGQEAELIYKGRIEALSDASPSNWLLTVAPDVYLYGSLVHTAPYLKDDERVAVWSSLYASAVASLNAASDRARHSGPLAMRVRTYG